MLRQRADSEADRAHPLELIRQMRADDRDEAGRQPALRRHDALRARREAADVPRGGHVFGEVEIVGAERVRRRRHSLVESVRQAGQHRLLTVERLPQRIGVGEIRMAD